MASCLHFAQHVFERELHDADKVETWSTEQKLKTAFQKAALRPALARDLRIFLDPMSLWCLSAFMSCLALVMWAAPITIPAVVGALQAYGIFFSAHQITDIGGHTLQFLHTAMTATSHNDLDRAGQHLETAVGKGGVAAVQLILLGIFKVGYRFVPSARQADLLRLQQELEASLKERRAPPLPTSAARCVPQCPVVNITPRTVAVDFRTIGANRTFVTPLETVTKVLGPLPKGNVMTITGKQARWLEWSLGLQTGSLESVNILTVIDDVAARAPASPLVGNGLFLGPRAGLPGGGNELTIAGVPTAGGPGTRQIVMKISP